MKTKNHLIQNLNAWDRYNKAICFIADLNTREVIKQFVIEGKGLTEIDKSLGKEVAEVRLYYGLKELAKYYRNLTKAKYSVVKDSINIL